MTKMDDDVAKRDATGKDDSKTETAEQGGGSLLREALHTLFWAFVIAFFVRTLAYEPFNIPSGSMKPTLLVGDYLFVSKYAYGFSRYSLPLSPPIFEGRIFGSEPKRGDVVVFKKPPENEIDYIKRVIGLPGDEIQVTAGRLYINGVLVERESAGTTMTWDEGGFPQRFETYIETLPNGVSHQIWEESDQEVHDNTPVFRVPEGHFFMMGDNRDHSLDSRAIGPVPWVNLVGRAGMIFFSHNNQASLLEIWKWPQAIRFSRIGDDIN
ncbi:MAG TPA: signal peptidase I [Kiloniellaceae bacterium]|nr:signal peptidase I [Kiloniellaceae bacterium]